MPNDETEGDSIAKTTSFSDINLKNWRAYDHVLTDSLWLFGARAKGNGHQLDYHGNFIPQIATQLLIRYTRPNEVALDLFLGSGTTAIESINLNRRCIGVELQERVVRWVQQKLPRDAQGSQVIVLRGDSAAEETVSRVREALRTMGREHAQLVILHPPYDDIIRFSDASEDLSNAGSTERFLDLFERVARNAYSLLDPGRFAALVIGDKYARGTLVPLGFWCMERMNAAGFRTKAIVVKNIEGNEFGKGKRANLWRYRALAGGYYIFKHEYVMIFQKPRKTGRSR